MTDILTKYYCDESITNNDQDKWLILLEYAYNIADQVEFNILFSDAGLDELLTELSQDLAQKGKRKDKIYRSGEFVRYRLSDRLKGFIQSKKYSDWHSFYFEDISFLKDGEEFFATITHENFVIIRLTENERINFNKRGFHFDGDWGTNPMAMTENMKEVSKSLLDKLKGFIK